MGGTEMAQKRKSVSKRTRFEVFKRDRFTCQYCGRKPPEVVLWIDHVIPVSKGGDNSRVNLLTSCRDCNAGKSDISLDEVMGAQAKIIQDGQEKLAQMKAMQRYVIAERKLLDANAKMVCVEFGNSGDNPNGTIFQSARMFVSRLPFIDVMEAVEKTTSRDKPFRYFCGICWKMIKERKELNDG